MARKTRLASIMIMHDGTSTIFHLPRVSRLGSTGLGFHLQSSGYPYFPTLIDKTICSDNWVVPDCDVVSTVKVQSGPRLNSMQHLPSKGGSKYVCAVGTVDKARLSPTKGVIVALSMSAPHNVHLVSLTQPVRNYSYDHPPCGRAGIDALPRHALTYSRRRSSTAFLMQYFYPRQRNIQPCNINVAAHVPRTSSKVGYLYLQNGSPNAGLPLSGAVSFRMHLERYGLTVCTPDSCTTVTCQLIRQD